MRKDAQRRLIAKYPKIFRQYELPPSQTNMCWGLEVGDGWYDLIDDMCSKIQKYIDEKYVKLTLGLMQIEASQVKQKFGSLRFYYSPYHPEIDEIVNEACERSTHTCEDCGSVEKVQMTKEGWITPLCNKCREKKEIK